MSVPIGECEKIFFLFPPTFRNLTWFRRHRFAGNLSPGLSVLEHGLVTNVTSDNVLYIPAGWLHATLTTKGGFLLSYDCATDDTLDTFALCGLTEAVEAPDLLESLLVTTKALFVSFREGESRDGEPDHRRWTRLKRVWTNVLLSLQQSRRQHRDLTCHNMKSWCRNAWELWASVDHEEFICAILRHIDNLQRNMPTRTKHHSCSRKVQKQRIARRQ